MALYQRPIPIGNLRILQVTWIFIGVGWRVRPIEVAGNFNKEVCPEVCRLQLIQQQGAVGPGC